LLKFNSQKIIFFFTKLKLKLKGGVNLAMKSVGTKMIALMIFQEFYNGMKMQN